jgi:hypothetical protein
MNMGQWCGMYVRTLIQRNKYCNVCRNTFYKNDNLHGPKAKIRSAENPELNSINGKVYARREFVCPATHSMS